MKLLRSHLDPIDTMQAMKQKTHFKFNLKDILHVSEEWGILHFFCLSCVSVDFFPKFVLLKNALTSHKIN